MKLPLSTVPTSSLPPLYGRWIDQLLMGPVPQESNATCDDCAMCTEESPNGSKYFFNPLTKCCTYVPALPNFLVGRILEDDDPAMAAGRATVESRLRAGAGVTPLGLLISPAYLLLYQHIARLAFGHSRGLRCPHYLEAEGGRCGVWKHRASVCATWYCKHVRGAVGDHFWTTLHQLLSAIEKRLAAWCVLNLDIGTEALRRLFPPPWPPAQAKDIDAETIDGRVNAATYRATWGRWIGREVDYYKACAGRVNPLTWEDVTTIGGAELAICARLAREAYQALLSNDLPPALTVGSLQVIRYSADTVHVCGYRGTDPLELPKALFDVLCHFDGRPVKQVVNAIRHETGIEVGAGLVRKLVDFQILVPSEQGALLPTSLHKHDSPLNLW